MSWRILVINNHSKLSYQNNNLIYRSIDRIEKIFIPEIHTLMLETTDIVISTALVNKLLENGVRIVFCDEKHNPSGEIQQYYGSHDTSKKVQQQMMWSDEIKRSVWTEIITQKIINQSILLKELGYIRSYEKLQSYIKEVQLFDPTNREGHAAKVYFNSLFGLDFSRDDDGNETNAYLNYGYTILLSVVNREVIKNGNITQVGLKHTNYFNPFNLSSDLMEPFRVIVDKKVLQNKDSEFKRNKHSMLEIFSDVYLYQNKKMFLTNIIEHYVSKALKALNESKVKEMMEFRIGEL